MTIPKSALAVIARLNEAGCEAYAVGGCVRDTLLGKAPHDWDVTTSALPELTLELFAAPPFKAIPTGIAHGTVTVLAPSELSEDGNASAFEPIEVTTFRVDGEYTDHRRPDSVSFTRSLAEDLSRRDFTINAMAYSPQSGIIDRFGGIGDLSDGIIRAVGDPYKRFDEDALRILRALRFAATLELPSSGVESDKPETTQEGFTIEPETARAALALAPSLTAVSRERITIELCKLLAGHNAEAILRDFHPIPAAILPKINPDCAKAVGLIHKLCINLNTKPTLSLLLSTFAAENALDALRLDNKTKSRAELIAELKSSPMSSALDARRLCAKCAAAFPERSEALDAARDCAIAAGKPESLEYIDEIRRGDICISIRELALKGRQIKELGAPPIKIGELQKLLLDAVIESPEKNEPETLISILKRIV